MALARLVVDLNWSDVSGAPGASVWHLRNNDGTSGGFADMAAEIGNFWSSITSLFTDSFTATFSGDLEGIGPDQGTLYTAAGWSVTGQQTGPPMPPADQMYVNWRAQTGGRSGRGRTYLGPLGLGVLEDNGTPIESYRTTVQNAAEALIEASDSSLNGAVVIWSRVDQVGRDIIQAEVPNRFAVLRSRRD